MDKSPGAFRTISEVAESLDLPQHVLRFWETRFPQVRPLKRGGGRRYYRPDDVELLRAIKRLLYDEGYTIKGVQKMLREQGAHSLLRQPAAPAAPEAKDVRSEERPDPPLRASQVPASALASDVDALRALLTELREAERLLSRVSE